MTVKVKLNPNQFSTVACRYPLETRQVVYSDEERDLFLEEAKNWRPPRPTGFFPYRKAPFVSARDGKTNLRCFLPCCPANNMLRTAELMCPG